MLELIFQGLIEWIYGLILDAWEHFSSALLDIMSMDFSYIESHIPIIPTIRQVILAVGWALLIGNLIFQAAKTMMSGLGFEGEDPKLLFTRTFAFSFLLLASPQICDLCLDMTSKIVDVMQMPTAVHITFADESTFVGLAGAWLLVVICGIIVMFQSFKLIIEMAERYLILAMLTLSAPLAFATGGSRNTSDIFSGWCRMYGSMCLLMILNVVFIKMLLSVLAYVPSGLDVLPWMILVLSIVKVAKKADTIITRIGLNPAPTGDSLGRSFPGMLTYAIARTVISNTAKAIGKNGGNSHGSGSGNSKANNGGNGGTTAGGKKPSPPNGPPPLNPGMQRQRPAGKQVRSTNAPGGGTAGTHTYQTAAQATSQTASQQNAMTQAAPIQQNAATQLGGQKNTVMSKQIGSGSINPSNTGKGAKVAPMPAASTQKGNMPTAKQGSASLPQQTPMGKTPLGKTPSASSIQTQQSVRSQVVAQNKSSFATAAGASPNNGRTNPSIPSGTTPADRPVQPADGSIPAARDGIRGKTGESAGRASVCAGSGNRIRSGTAGTGKGPTYRNAAGRSGNALLRNGTAGNRTGGIRTPAGTASKTSSVQYQNNTSESHERESSSAAPVQVPAERSGVAGNAVSRGQVAGQAAGKATPLAFGTAGTAGASGIGARSVKQNAQLGAKTNAESKAHPKDQRPSQGAAPSGENKADRSGVHVTQQGTVVNQQGPVNGKVQTNVRMREQNHISVHSPTTPSGQSAISSAHEAKTAQNNGQKEKGFNGIQDRTYSSKRPIADMSGKKERNAVSTPAVDHRTSDAKQTQISQNGMAGKASYGFSGSAMEKEQHNGMGNPDRSISAQHGQTRNTAAQEREAASAKTRHIASKPTDYLRHGTAGITSQNTKAPQTQTQRPGEGQTVKTSTSAPTKPGKQSQVKSGRSTKKRNTGKVAAGKKNAKRTGGKTNGK